MQEIWETIRKLKISCSAAKFIGLWPCWHGRNWKTDEATANYDNFELPIRNKGTKMKQLIGIALLILALVSIITGVSTTCCSNPPPPVCSGSLSCPLN
jgi:hypothetical protein